MIGIIDETKQDKSGKRRTRKKNDSLVGKAENF